jgi:Universal stress protein family
MKRFQKIMVVLGQESLGPQHAVLERATRLAQENRASLWLVTLVEEFPRVARWLLRSADDLMELIEKERLQRVEALAAAIRNQGVEATASVLRGRIGLDTVREVLRHGPDLLIKDAEECGDRLVGSSDWYLLRAVPTPFSWSGRPRKGTGSGGS